MIRTLRLLGAALVLILAMGTLGAPAQAAPTADAPGWTWEVRGDGVRYVSPRGTFTVPNANGFVAEHARFGGGRGTLGYPTGPVRNQPSLGSYQTFERGVIYASQAGTIAVKGGASPFARVHAANGGGGGGALGYPIRREVSQGGGYWYQQFDLGTIYVSPRGSFAVTDRPGAAYAWGESFGGVHGLNGGGGGRLGYPVSNVVSEGGRYGYQQFERGVVYCGALDVYSASPEPVCASVKGGFLAQHAAHGGGRGAMGYPIYDEDSYQMGCEGSDGTWLEYNQGFERAVVRIAAGWSEIYWTPYAGWDC